MCSRVVDEKKDLELTNSMSSYKLDIEEAISLVESLTLDGFMETPSTLRLRNHESNNVEDVRVFLKGDVLRSAEVNNGDNHVVDTLMYALSLSNNTTVIVSADKRTEPFLAILSGKVDENTKSTWWSSFVEKVELYVNANLKKDLPQPSDNVRSTILFQMFTIGPNLTFQWHLDKPFNDESPYWPRGKAGQRYKVGCVPLAIGTLVAHYGGFKAPTKDGFSYDWGLISRIRTEQDMYANQEGRRQVCHLLKYIADEVDIEYDILDGEAYAYTKKGIDIFKNYRVVKNVSDSVKKLNSKKSADEIFNLFLEERNGFVVCGGAGHSFVIDGLAWYASGGLKKNKYLYHCRLGLPEESDGYYLSYLFDDEGFEDLQPLLGKNFLNKHKLFYYIVSEK